MSFFIFCDGRLMYVHTEVGDGLTQVCVEAAEPEEEQSIESAVDE